ncbi:MAG: TonB-dependent receptor plug domain-containing protein [Treponema sp.]|nr:TonB-dependent receptor plug domain-containing protein [Treponema sp.]
MISLKEKVLIIPVFFLCFFSVFARDVEITVLDMDMELPLEGASVRSWDGNVHISGGDGKVVIGVPDDRQVVIQAAYPGYETGRLIITITENSYTAFLRLSGIMESRELVIEAVRPGSGETRTGRSVAVTGREITQTAEIGIIEDVISSIKLLPGVGYAGFFNAQPSIRGGEPADMRASLDGYYILNPYHWGGGYSIFDPRMVDSAQLSHGVYSSRYGHSISGLLEITTKKPSPSETQFELGINTSSASFNYSLPFTGSGGILFMGRITYYSPVLALAKELGKTIDALSIVNSVRVAPYIGSAAVTGNYRFTDTFEFTASGFWGMDGVGASFENSSSTALLTSSSSMDADWANYQGFINTALLWNPRNDMLLKLTMGTGYEQSLLDANMPFNIYSKSFVQTPANERYYNILKHKYDEENPYSFFTETFYEQDNLAFNAQGRIDYDWDPGKGFLLAAGLQEMFTFYNSTGNQQINIEKNLYRFDPDTQALLFDIMGISDPVLKNYLIQNLIVSLPLEYNPDAENKLFTTSVYTLMEYSSPGRRFNGELGLRVDHYYLNGKGISLGSEPAFNPRLNLDLKIFQGQGIMRSIDLSAGTGLFSSMNNNVFIAEEEYNIAELKPNRSWTSVAGARLEFSFGLVLNIEGYYKYIFDRMYIPVSAGLDGIEVRPNFDGEGRAWGIDLLLQKLQSRFWDGWLSYSFSWVKFRDPDGGNADMGFSGGIRGNDWYFPSYHRYHNLNLVINIKPAPKINIYTRFGFASGVQLSRRTTDTPFSYPVYMYYHDNPEDSKFIEVYYWPSVRDENNRTTPSLPLDMKISIFGNNKTGKTRYEVYAAVENILALLYTSEGNTSFNRYTGQVDTGSTTASYEMPIPIPSFGVKLSY